MIESLAQVNHPEAGAVLFTFDEQTLTRSGTHAYFKRQSRYQKLIRTKLMLNRVKSHASLLLWLIGISTLVNSNLQAEDNAFASATIDMGCVVSDVDKAVEFYTKAIGFKELPGFSVPADFASRVGLTNGKKLDIKVLVLGEGEGATRLKLMHVEGERSKKTDNRFIHSQQGFSYLTVKVKDTAKALQRLEKAGIKPIARGSQELPASLAKGIYLTIVRDPDGNLIELVGPKP